MKKGQKMRKFIIIIAIAAIILPAGAAQKIVTVNIEKLFNAYYKTPQVENIIRKQAQVYQNYLTKKMEKARELDKKFRVELDKAQNVTLSNENRSKAAQQAEKYNSEIRLLRAEMETYSNEKRKEMANMTIEKRASVMQDISNVIRKVAEGMAADFVFDVSGKTTHQIPALIYANPATDITNDVLKILNKGNVPEKKDKK